MEHPVSPKASLARPEKEAAIPAHLKCIACSKLLVNCFHSKTGFRLCQHCVEGLHPTLLVPCPGTSDADDEALNRMVSRATFLPDLGTRREMSKLSVLCPNYDSGCRVHLIWRNVDSHLIEECDFEMCQCQLCSESIVLKKLLSSHKDLQTQDCCPNFWAYCPVCGDSSQLLNRETISEHLATTCPAQPTPCKYSSFGCKMVLLRWQLQYHYKNNKDEHLEQLAARLMVLEADSIDKDRKLKQMSVELAQLKQEKKKYKQSLKEKDQNIQQWLCYLQSRIDVLEAGKVRHSSNMAVSLETGTRKHKENCDQVNQETSDATKIHQTRTPRTSATSKHRRNLSLADNSQIAVTLSDLKSLRKPIDAIRNRIKRPRVEAILETNKGKMVESQPVSHRRSSSDGSF